MNLADIRKRHGLDEKNTEKKSTTQTTASHMLDEIRARHNLGKVTSTREKVEEAKAKPRLYKNEAEYYAKNDYSQGRTKYDELLQRDAELESLAKELETETYQGSRKGTQYINWMRDREARMDANKADREKNAAKVAEWDEFFGEGSLYGYNELAKNEDFEQNSRAKIPDYISKGLSGLELMASEDYGKADTVYNYINNIGNTREAVNEAKDPTSTFGKYDNMTDDERKLYTYIHNTKGAEDANNYLKKLGLEQRGFEKAQAADEQFAKDKPVTAWLISRINNGYLTAQAGADLIMQTIKKLATGEDINYYSTAQAMHAGKGTFDAAVAKKAQEAVPIRIAGIDMTKLAVSALSSGIDSMAFSVLPGGAGAIALAVDAGISGMRTAAQNGATDGQALLKGVSSAVFEYLFERVSLGNFKAMQETGISGWKDVFKNITKSMGVNMTEEMATEAANIAYDMLLGYDYSEIQGASGRDLLKQVVEAGLSGMLMGIGFGAAGNISSGVQFQQFKNEWTEEVKQQLVDNGVAEEDAEKSAKLLFEMAMEEQKQTAAAQSGAEAANDTTSAEIPSNEAVDAYTEMVNKYADTMDANGQNVFIEAYDGSVEPDVYVKEMQDAYDAGRRGEELAASETAIGDDRRQLAYKAGEADAAARKADAFLLNNGRQEVYNNANTINTEVKENAYAGRYDLGRGSQWNDGENTYEQVRSLESGAGQDQAGRVNPRSRDEEAAALELGIQVSTNTFGIEGGSTSRDIRIVLDGETKATKAARDMLESRGLEVIFFAGNNLTITRGKDTASVRGYISGDRVYIRVDHPDFTAEQIAKHEATHDRIRRGEVTVADVRDRLVADGYDIDRVVDLYEEAYRGAGMSYDELLEEIVCDSEANINIFSSRRTLKADYMLEVAQAVRKTERRPDSARAPPAEQSEGKFSREITSDSPLTAIEEARQALKENDAEIRKLTAQLEKAKGQVKKTERPSLMKADVNRLAKKIIGDHASTLKANDIYAELDALAKAVIKKGVDDVIVSDLVHTLAEKITESAEVLVDDGMRDDYRGIKKYLRETPIAFNDKSDIPDWNIFHKRNIGRIRISQKGTGIDKVYIDLQERYGKALFPDNIDAPADQLLHFAELLDDLRDTYENPYDMDMAVAVEQTVNDILADIQTEQLRETPKTFADKANDKLKKARSKAVAAKNEALKKVRADRDKKIADLKERHKESTEKARESRKARELRGRITRHVADLSVKLRNPTDKQHIPERLRASVAKVLEAINLESAYSYDESGRRVKSREGVATKRTLAFEQLRRTYAEIAGDITVDPELVMAGGNLDIVLEMADTPIAEMTSAQLQTVWETLKAVETSIRTANKLFAAERFETVSSLTEALRRDNKGKKAAAEIFGWSALQRGVVLANESPETFFHLLGETGDYLFRMLRNAQDRQTVLTAAVKRFTHSENMAAIKDAKAWEKEIHTVKLGGEEVKMSAAQIMELYVLSRRKAAMDHILIGGILPENAKGKGLKIESRVNPVRGVTMEELLDVFKVLTAEQKDIANKLQKFASTTLSEWGNEASMKVYGYKKFNEPDYWTIRSNKQEIKSTTESVTGTPSIANKGFTKTTKPHANNSLMIGSIFDTFANHASEMVNYAAYLDVIEDVGKVRNFVFFDVDGQRSGSVKEIVDTVHGKTGSEWLEKLLTDIAVGTKGLGGKSWFDSLFAKAKATSVGANLSVIVQQPTAIIRAMAEINPRYFVSGKSALKGWKKATEYAPIAQWKDWGYFDIRSGRQMKELFFDTDTAVDKVTQLGMAPAGLMDSLSWGALWNAVENETKAKRTDLAPETKAFYQAVAKRFTEIVEKTQVVDGVLQRSDMMRSDNAFNRMATAFMGEPTKQYNMVIRAFYDVKYAGKGGKAKAAKKMVASSFVLLVSGVLNAAVKSLVGALRDDDKEKKYWEKWADTFAGENLKEFGKSNLGGTLNPLTYIPVVKDVVSLVQGYDISRMDMALVAEAVKAATNMQKAMNDEGGKTIAGASVDMMVALSKLTGIPVGNIKRDVESVINTIASESDNYLLQYRMEKAVKSIDYSGNKKQFMAILYGAYTNDKEAYEIIYNDLVESGYNVESIRGAMEDRMKEDQGVKSVAELEQRWLPPTEQGKYDSRIDKLEASKLWKEATSKQKNSVEADLYNYLAGTKKGESIAEDISGGKAVGLTDTEYMLYQLALEMCDEPTESGKMGVINQSEAKKALDMLDELSDREKAYLWSITNSGWKSNPWD